MNTQIIKEIAHELVDKFLSELKYGLASPATFEQEYGEDDCLMLKVKFNEYGGGPSPDDASYELEIVDFDFYTLTDSGNWKWITSESIGITENDFK